MDEKSKSIIAKEDKKKPGSALGSVLVEEIQQYDKIFVLYPIWWYILPVLINTFLESNYLAGKEIVFFQLQEVLDLETQ